MPSNHLEENPFGILFRRYLHFGEYNERDDLCLPASDRTFKDIRFFNKHKKEFFYSVPYPRVLRIFVQYKNDANSDPFKENSKTKIKDIPTSTFADSKVMLIDSELTGKGCLNGPSHWLCFVAYSKMP